MLIQLIAPGKTLTWISLSTIDILTILESIVYNVNISARIHPPLKQRIPLKSK